MTRVSVVPAFVAVVVLALVGASVPASAGGLLGWLFGSNRPTVAQFVTLTCKVSVTPRDLNFNVRAFTVKMPRGVSAVSTQELSRARDAQEGHDVLVQPTWDTSIPIAKTEVQVVTGILELTPGSGEITKVELTLDSQRDAFKIVEPPDVVEDREMWLRDTSALLRGQHRQERGYRLGREVFPPFVSVGKHDKRPNGPVIFATPVSQLEFGAHSITARITTKGGGQQVAEAVVEFLIIPDPSGMVDLNRVPGSPAAIPAVQQEQIPVPTPASSPILGALMEFVGYTGDPSQSSLFSTSVVREGFEGLSPIMVVCRNPNSEVGINGKVMRNKRDRFCIIWTSPGMNARIDIDGSLLWQGNAPARGEGLWLVQ